MSQEGERRRLYQEVAEAHWKEWNAKIERLVADVRVSRDRATLRREVAELQRRQYALTGLLGDLQRASNEDWEPIQKDLDAMFGAVQRAHGRVRRVVRDRMPAREAHQEGTGIPALRSADRSDW